jgi:MYXO-CTERM domain-containing protein
MISSQSYADGIDAIVAANSNYAGWDGWKDAIQGAATLPADVSIDEFSRNPDAYRGVATVDTAKFLQLLDEKVVRPVADPAALFYRAPYLTRLYTTMSSDEMTLDPSFDYNFDLAQVSNVHIAKQFTQCSAALNQDDAPWRIELPQGGVIDSDGSGAWPVAEDSLPANLKIVALSTSGSGSVIKDNSAEIRGRLGQGAGTNRSDLALLQAPQNGVMIGGSQTLTARGQMLPSQSSPKPASDDHCGVSRVHAGTPAAPWLAIAGLIFALRRRRSQRQEPHKP